MGWWQDFNVCRLCNNTGLINVYSLEGMGKNIMPYVSSYVCKCQWGKDYHTERTKEITDQESGKQKKIKVKRVISKRYFEFYEHSQFPFTEQKPLLQPLNIDYQEVFNLYLYHNLERFYNGARDIDFDIQVLKDYLEKRPNLALVNIGGLVKSVKGSNYKN